jgi:hypothetical protein
MFVSSHPHSTDDSPYFGCEPSREGVALRGVHFVDGLPDTPVKAGGSLAGNDSFAASSSNSSHEGDFCLSSREGKSFFAVVVVEVGRDIGRPPKER